MRNRTELHPDNDETEILLGKSLTNGTSKQEETSSGEKSKMCPESLEIDAPPTKMRPATSSKRTAMWKRVIISALAGMGAATFCHPLDVIRVQLQTDSEGGKAKQYNGFVDAAKQIYSKDGIRHGLYAGLSAAYLRQWLNGSIRMSVYSHALNHCREKNGGNNPGLTEKLMFGAISSGLGAFVGTPSELAIVRMGADNASPLEERRGYTGIINFLWRVVKEESIFGLWKGATVSVIRAVIVGSTGLGITSETKQILMKTAYFSDGSISLVAISAIFASLIGNLIANPFDVVKSRLQNMKHEEYAGIIDCVQKSVAFEGVWVLWSGFSTAFLKHASYTVISLSLLERMSIIVTGNAGL